MLAHHTPFIVPGLLFVHFGFAEWQVNSSRAYVCAAWPVELALEGLMMLDL